MDGLTNKDIIYLSLFLHRKSYHFQSCDTKFACVSINEKLKCGGGEGFGFTKDISHFFLILVLMNTSVED